MLYIDRVEDNAVSLYELYGHALAQETLPGVMIFKILVDRSYIFNLSDTQDEEKKYYNFTL